MIFQYLDYCLARNSGQYMLTTVTYNLYFVSFQQELEIAQNIKPHLKEDNYVYLY